MEIAVERLLCRRSKKSEEKRLQDLAQEILKFLGHKNAAVEINLVESNVMRSLNRKFKGKDSTTNILSFEAPKNFPCIPGKTQRFLGEIYLDPIYISRRGENIEYLLAHGLLHLLGFGHKRYDDRINMEKIEKKLGQWQKTKF